MDNNQINDLVCEIQKEFHDTGTYNKKKMEALWLAFKPIVDKISYYKSMKTGGQHKDDLVQVCYLALCSAVNKYQKTKIDFRKYAMYWFMAFIRLENIRNVSIFKYSSRLDRKLFGKVSQVAGLPLEEQAIILGVKPEDLEAFLLSTKVTKSILKKRSEDSDIEEEEYISSDYPQPDFLFDLKQIYETSKDVFDSFMESLTSERERDVLNLLRRVGNPEKGNFAKDPSETEPQTYQDLADKYGVTRERMRQIACALKDKLRYRLEKNGVNSSAYHAFI